VVHDPCQFAERQEGGAQLEPQINGLYQCVVALGELRQGIKRLLKIRRSFAVCRAGYRPSPGLAAIRQSLIPYCAQHGVVGQTVHLLGQAVRGERFKGLDNAGV
jgi:hypothetical protein